MEEKPSQDDIDRLLVRGITHYERLIGSGRFGKVFEVKYYGTTCAAKEIQAEAAGRSEIASFVDQFKEQLCKYSVLRHPNIIQFLGIVENALLPAPQEETIDEANAGDNSDEVKESKATKPPQIPYAILTELMASNLTSLLEKHENISLHVKLSILCDVALGLNYLHTQTPPFVHGRLYSNNILLSTQLVAKIGDLGYPQYDGDTPSSSSPGLCDFVPPKSKDAGASVDTFSYGNVIIHTITQEWPTPVDTEASEPLQIDRRRKYLEKISGELKLLVMSCLDDDPNSRPTAAELVESVKKVKDERKSPFADMNPITWLAEIDTLSSKLEDTLLELEDANQLLTEHEEQIDQLQVIYIYYWFCTSYIV